VVTYVQHLVPNLHCTQERCEMTTILVVLLGVVSARWRRVGVFSLARISARWQFDHAVDPQCKISSHQKSNPRSRRMVPHFCQM
jgi:hypothetical protein